MSIFPYMVDAEVKPNYSGADDEISIFDLAEIVEKFISAGYKLNDDGIAIKEAVKCLKELNV